MRRRAGHEGQWEAEFKKKWKPVELVREIPAVCRKETNRRVNLIKRMFKWAVSEEPVPHRCIKRS